MKPGPRRNTQINVYDGSALLGSVVEAIDRTHWIASGPAGDQIGAYETCTEAAAIIAASFDQASAEKLRQERGRGN